MQLSRGRSLGSIWEEGTAGAKVLRKWVSLKKRRMLGMQGREVLTVSGSVTGKIKRWERQTNMDGLSVLNPPHHEVDSTAVPVHRGGRGGEAQKAGNQTLREVILLVPSRAGVSPVVWLPRRCQAPAAPLFSCDVCYGVPTLHG